MASFITASERLLLTLRLYKEMRELFYFFYCSYRDAEKNFHSISNRGSYTDCSGNEETEDVSGILQCTANVLGMYFFKGTCFL